jgi:SAM-dependent methyltransferase
MIASLALLAGGGAACRSAARREAPAARPVEAPLPPGVLARAHGLQGPIEVIERAGHRLLVIDGVVQGGVPLTGAAATTDPAAARVRALRPAARRALVIGLGTGRTASDLAAAGFAVEAVELEPAVIELARAHFGYRGHAVSGDGIAYLAAGSSPYDVILVDAFTRRGRSAELSEGGALQALVDRLAADGVVAFRFVGAPEPATLSWLRQVGRALETNFVALFGSGVGGEEQNLVAVGSRRPLNLVDRPELSLWPLWHADGPELAVTGSALEPAGSAEAAERRVQAIGYVIRLASGELALDLPHEGMGAVRYLLAGGPAAALGRALPRDAEFLHDDALGERDPAASPPLRGLLGGGGALRSDTRFSPLAAAVEGRARFRSLVSPDAADVVPAELRRGAPTDARVLRGGALYDLTVERVLWSLDHEGFAALLAALAPHRDAALAGAEAGDLEAVDRALAGYLATLAERLGEAARHLRLAVVAAGWRQALATAASQVPAERPLHRAIRCEAAEAAGPFEWGEGLLDPLRYRLRRCALREYRAALGSTDAMPAAARLLHLLDEELAAEGLPARARAALRRELAALRRRHPDARPMADRPAP